MKPALLPLVRAAIALVDTLVIGVTRAGPASTKVLIVRVDSIGDLVLWSDAGRALKEHYNALGHEVVLLGNQAWTTWAAALGLCDEVWSVDPDRLVRDLPYRWAWLRRLRRTNFSTVIQPVYSRSFLLGDSLVRATAARKRIGFSADVDAMTPFFRRWSNRWYTRLVPMPRVPVMELERNADFVRRAGVTDFAARVPVLPPLPVEHSLQLPPAGYAVLFPGASWIGRAWPPEKFAEIGRRLVARGVRIVIAGGTGDRKRADTLVRALDGEVLDLVGGTSLPGVTELLRGACVVIANETSAVHIGAAVGVPVVCILGGGHFGRFAPYDPRAGDRTRPLPTFVWRQLPCYGCNWICRFPRAADEPVKCVREVTVDEVWGAVDAALSNSDHGSRNDPVRQ